MLFETRQATEIDRDQLFELYATTLKDYITKIWGWDESWQKKDFNAHFELENIQVAVTEDRVFGYMQIDASSETPHIRMMCVSPEYQNQGVGSNFLESFIRHCSETNRNITLKVFRANTGARRLYEKYGFEVFSETETHFEMRYKA